jgi:hypothetical protein
MAKRPTRADRLQLRILCPGGPDTPFSFGPEVHRQVQDGSIHSRIDKTPFQRAPRRPRSEGKLPSAYCPEAGAACPGLIGPLDFAIGHHLAF